SPPCRSITRYATTAIYTLSLHDALPIFPATKVDHVQYDPISYSGVTSANQKSFGKRVFPSYDLTKADVIVSVDADFLSSWGSTTDRKSTRLNSSHVKISYAVFCLKKKIT